MNRHYSIEEITDILLALKRTDPDLQLFTSIIIGFPSETTKEFLATLNAVKKVRFDRVDVHAYSARPNTVASRMDDKIDNEVVRKRMITAITFLEQQRIKNAVCAL